MVAYEGAGETAFGLEWRAAVLQRWVKPPGRARPQRAGQDGSPHPQVSTRGGWPQGVSGDRGKGVTLCYGPGISALRGHPHVWFSPAHHPQLSRLPRPVLIHPLLLGPFQKPLPSFLPSSLALPQGHTPSNRRHDVRSSCLLHEAFPGCPPLGKPAEPSTDYERLVEWSILLSGAPLDKGGIGGQLLWQFKLMRTGPGQCLGRG